MWIELHDSARDHPKLIKLARDLGIPKVHAFGHLCSLWTWVLRMAPDGDLSSFDTDDIEIGAEWGGTSGLFVSSAEKRGFLDRSNFGLVVHDWSEYSGSLKTAQRVREHRARKRSGKVKRNVTLQGVTVMLGNAEQEERPTDRSSSSSSSRVREGSASTLADLEALSWQWEWSAHTLSPKQRTQATGLLEQGPLTADELAWAREQTETKASGRPNFGLLLCKVADYRRQQAESAQPARANGRRKTHGLNVGRAPPSTPEELAEPLPAEFKTWTDEGGISNG